MNEQGVMDVLLQNASPFNPVCGIFDYVLNFIVFFGYFDALALVGVFARFDDPYIFGRDLGIIILFLLFFAIGLI